MIGIGYVSPFVPPEWIAAHGLAPRRLRLGVGGGRPLAAAARGICPYSGALIDAALSSVEASALVLTTTCDQMRYAAAMVERRGSCPTFLLNVPSTWQTPAAAGLFVDELRRLGDFLIRFGGKCPSNERLAEVMLATNGTPSTNSRRLTAAGTEEIPLAIVGGPMLESDDALFDLIEQGGGRVVLDATEGGERTMPRPFDAERTLADPLRELADAYFSIPDVFHRPNDRLYEWLGNELAARQVRGIILRRYVWCDLWHAEVQRMKQWSRLPMLELDVGPDDITAPNRLQGRIEAFFETLK